MKIGILTFHREVNDGSMLQCFCLYRLLNEIFPSTTVEIIDYLPTHVRKRRRPYVFLKRPPFIWQQGDRGMRRAHDEFLQEHFRVSPTIKVDDSVESARRAILRQDYDAIVVGSDTVWDTRPNTGAPQVPNIFSLPGLSGLKRIAFAASMDKGGPRHVAPDVWRTLIDEIADFDFLSVRDQTTERWIRDGGVPQKRIRFMPDPTLLFDFSEIVITPSSLLDSHRNLAGVAVSDVALQREATRQLAGLGYQVFNLLRAPVEGQIPIPEEWSYGERVGILGHLQFLVTDRFHASIFALKQRPGTPVLLVEPDYFYPETNSKGRDLFDRLGMSDMVWRYISKKEIPVQLIEKALEKHAANSPDVQGKLSALNSVARATIQTLARLLR